MRLQESIDIAAPPEQVSQLFQDWARWPSIYPTIRGTSLVGVEDGQVVIDVDHVEGHVRNTLQQLSPTDVLLREDKHTYRATFENRFAPDGVGTRYTVTGDIHLRGLRRLVGPLIHPRIRRMMRRYQLEPLKQVAEGAVRER